MAKSKNKRKKPKPTYQQMLTKLKSEIVGLSYQWTDEKLMVFIDDGNEASEYVIDPKTVNFSHQNPRYKMHARYIFTQAKQLLSKHIPLQWSVNIKVEFENDAGDTFGSESEGAAKATFTDLAGWVTDQVYEALDKAKNASMGELGQLNFKRAHFKVSCEGQ
jgi:hypothetical protein